MQQEPSQPSISSGAFPSGNWRHKTIVASLSRALELLKDTEGPPMEQVAAAAALNLCKQIRAQLIDKVYSTGLELPEEKMQRHQSAKLLPSLTQPVLQAGALQPIQQLPISHSAPQLRSSRSEPQLKQPHPGKLPWAPMPAVPLFGSVERVFLRQVGAKEGEGQCWRRLGRRLRLRSVYLSESWAERAREDLHVAQTASAYRQSRHASSIAVHKLRLQQMSKPERVEELRLSEEEAMAERVRRATEAAILAEERRRKARDALVSETAMRLPRWYSGEPAYSNSGATAALVAATAARANRAMQISQLGAVT